MTWIHYLLVHWTTYLLVGNGGVDGVARWQMTRWNGERMNQKIAHESRWQNGHSRPLRPNLLAGERRLQRVCYWPPARRPQTCCVRLKNWFCTVLSSNSLAHFLEVTGQLLTFSRRLEQLVYTIEFWQLHIFGTCGWVTPPFLLVVTAEPLLKHSLWKRPARPTLLPL